MPDVRPNTSEASGVVQVRVLLYLGALCSGILESLADVEKAALAALSAPRHPGGAWPAVRRALHIRSQRVDDPEDPSGPRSPARKQALQQTWMEMLSATSAAFQKQGTRLDGSDGVMPLGDCVPCFTSLLGNLGLNSGSAKDTEGPAFQARATNEKAFCR